MNKSASFDPLIIAGVLGGHLTGHHIGHKLSGSLPNNKVLRAIPGILGGFLGGGLVHGLHGALHPTDVTNTDYSKLSPRSFLKEANIMITPTDVHTFIQKYAREINFDPSKAAPDNTDLARQKENEIAAKKYAEKPTGVMRLKGGETESGYRSPTITGAAAKTPEESKALLNKAMRR